MDLVKTVRIVRRRWYAVVAGAVLILIGIGLVAAMGPTYEASSVLVLLPPSTPSRAATTPGAEAGPVNPYQAFDSSIAITAELMSTQLTQPAVVDELVRRGASPDYTVVSDAETGGPTVTITAKASTPHGALVTAGLVSQEFRRQLAGRQRASGAPANTLITASEVVTPSHAEQLVSGRVRALVAVIAVGSVISICLALAAETIAVAWEQKRDREACLESANAAAESARGRVRVPATGPSS